MPAKKPPAAVGSVPPPAKRHYTKRAPGTNRGGRPRQLVHRSAQVAFTTFSEVSERLDAMALLQGRPTRAGLVEHYVADALDRDETRLGLGMAGGDDAKLRRAMKKVGLDKEQQTQILAYYRRIGLLDDAKPAPRTAGKARAVTADAASRVE